jgi:lysozyme
MSAPRAKVAVGGGLAGSAAVALAMAVASLKIDEGKRSIDYLDIARVPTACYGHTGADVRVGRVRSDAECEAILTGDAARHLQGVLRCTPALHDRPYQLAAATRLAFNIGVSGYCGSIAARRFGAGNWRGGCDAFLSWDKARVSGRLVRVRGLTLRRERERAQCLTGLGR